MISSRLLMKNQTSGLASVVVPLACGQTRISSAFGIGTRRMRRLGTESSEPCVSFTSIAPGDHVYREAIKRALNLPSTCVLEYKTNNGASTTVCRFHHAHASPDSMQDKSSFRTTPVIDRQ